MALLGKGTKVGVSISSVFKYFPDIVGTISGINPTVSNVDTTTHDTVGYVKTSIPTMVDNGEISFEMLMTPADLVDTTEALGYCRSRLGAGNTDTFKLLYTDGLYQTFTGYVTAVDQSAPLEDKMTIKVTIKVAGAVSEAVQETT